MAYQLTEEVAQFAPPGLPLGERKILDAIATEARVATRTWDLSHKDMARVAGLTPSGFRAALRRLRGRGVEVMVPIPGRVGRDGRPLYAHQGHVTRWYLPPMDQVARVLEDKLAASVAERNAKRTATREATLAARAATPTTPGPGHAVPPCRPVPPSAAMPPFLPAPAPDPAAAPDPVRWPAATVAALAAELTAEQEVTSLLHRRLAERDQVILDLRQQLQQVVAMATAVLQATATTPVVGSLTEAAHLWTASDPAEVVHSPALAAAGDKGGIGWQQGGHPIAARGASDAPPPRTPRDVPAHAGAREAPAAACGQPAEEPVDAGDPALADQIAAHLRDMTDLRDLADIPGLHPLPDLSAPPAPAPTWRSLAKRLGPAAPRCLQHDDWPSRRRVPDCGDCARLRRSWDAARTELNLAEARARRACRRCDDLGWDLAAATDGQAAYCPHPGHGPRPAPGSRAAPAPPMRAAG